jgi:hypothetical protein
MVKKLERAFDSFLRGPADDGHAAESEPVSTGTGEGATEAPISAEAKIGQKAIQAPDPQSPDERMFTLSRGGGRQVEVNPLYLI